MSEFEQIADERVIDAAGLQGGQGDWGELSFCLIETRGTIFGIETTMVREVLGRTDRRVRKGLAVVAKDRHDLRRVPLAPSYVAGVIPYRGEVLTTLSLRALLGDECWIGEGCVLVLDDAETGEKLGLMVDGVNGVLTISKELREENPCTLDARGRALFNGVYKLPAGLMVSIDPARLSPARLAASEAFEQRQVSGGAACAL